jgi:hypothetical protein
MWHAMASSKPPPNAKPFTAAMTGLVMFSILLNKVFCPFLASSSAFSCPKSLNSLMSAATKIFLRFL